MHDPEQFRRLLKDYLQGTLPETEEAAFLQLLAAGDHRDQLGEDILVRLQTPPADGHAAQVLDPERRQQIIRRILAEGDQDAKILPFSPRRHWRRWTAAACLILALGAGLLVYRSVHRDPGAGFLANDGALQEKKNDGRTVLPIRLEDGSIVELQPGSRLHYPAHFTGQRREVSLEGTAFFRIAPNAARPFYAYSKGLVTHVLGTSFNIAWNGARSEIRVAVRTGKVAVSRRKNEQDNPSSPAQTSFLEANQQVVCSEDSRELRPTLVDTPAVISAAPASFVFKATPVSEIFAALRQAYGIDIIMENEGMGKNLFTGDLSQQSFYTALKIVCLSLNHAYVVSGTKIIITQ